MKFKFFLKCSWRSERAYCLKSFSSVLAKSVLNLILVEEKGRTYASHIYIYISTRQHQILQYKLFGSIPHSVTRHSHEGLFSSGFLPDPKKCDVTPTRFSVLIGIDGFLMFLALESRRDFFCIWRCQSFIWFDKQYSKVFKFDKNCVPRTTFSYIRCGH